MHLICSNHILLKSQWFFEKINVKMNVSVLNMLPRLLMWNMCGIWILTWEIKDAKFDLSQRYSGILIGTFHPGLINSILFILNESARSQILMKPKEMIVGIAWHRDRRFWLIWDRCKRRLTQSQRVCFGDQKHSEVVPALETVLARTWVSYVQLIVLDRNTGTCKSWFSYVDYKSHVSTQRQ